MHTLKKDIVVYKKAGLGNGGGPDCIVVLELKAGTKVNLDTTDSWNDHSKNRASEARVVRIETLGGKPLKHVFATSNWDGRTRYHVGDIMKPKRGFSRTSDTCASGIHFYVARAAAKRH